MKDGCTTLMRYYFTFSLSFYILTHHNGESGQNISALLTVMIYTLRALCFNCSTKNNYTTMGISIPNTCWYFNRKTSIVTKRRPESGTPIYARALRATCERGADLTAVSMLHDNLLVIKELRWHRNLPLDCVYSVRKRAWSAVSVRASTFIRLKWLLEGWYAEYWTIRATFTTN